jgi:hypothetical protein
LQDWRPDLIVRETSEFGGYLAAEYLGVPFATIDISPQCPLDNDDVLTELNIQREQLGLAAIDDPLDVLTGFCVAVVPAPFCRSPAWSHWAVRTAWPAGRARVQTTSS